MKKKWIPKKVRYLMHTKKVVKSVMKHKDTYKLGLSVLWRKILKT